MEMLELNNLHKTFNPGTVNEKVALNGVSLHMEAGDFATIVGSNGAGKSTMFNAITGGFIADEGSIVLGVVFGSCLYRFIVAVALRFNVPAAAMKLVSALIVAVAISMPAIRAKFAFEQRKHNARKEVH